MVAQKKVSSVSKGKLKKNLKEVAGSQGKQVLPLAGPREVLALQVLHTMFLKNLARETDSLTFEGRKNSIDKNTLMAGARKALNNAKPKKRRDSGNYSAEERSD